MNGRIKDIAMRAHAVAVVSYKVGTELHGTTLDFSEVFNQEFAEMLVRECARISTESDSTWTGQGPAGAAEMMEYFGITQ